MIQKNFAERDGRRVCQVVFSLPGSLWAETVHLVGDFNSWNRTSHPLVCGRDGTWTITMEFECDRTLQFRYLLDGTSWTNDSQADAYTYNPYGSDNCVLITDPTFEVYNG